MSFLDKNTNQVSGPINVVRMEGHINKIKKIIYIFMDQHFPISMQTECDNVFSTDINTYFAENFSKLNEFDKMYDFFLEIRPTNLQNIKHGYPHKASVNYRDIYIGELFKLFRKIFEYDTKKNKVMLSKYFKNIRLHYMDVRDYFESNQYDALSEANYYANQMMSHQHIHENNLDRIIYLLKNFSEYCSIILSVIDSYKSFKTKKLKKINMIKFSDSGEKANDTSFNQQNDPNKDVSQFKIFADNIDYIMNKIFTKYNHSYVKDKLQKQLFVLEKYLVNLHSDTDFLINEFITILNSVTDLFDKLSRHESPIVDYGYGMPFKVYLKMIFFIRDSLSDLLNKYTYFFTRFMDIYFLRRFLDKNYITNTITYTGSYHSTVYINFLLKECGFKITHVSYSKISNINDLNKKILEIDESELGEIFYPELRSQCSDLSNFPKNFS